MIIASIWEDIYYTYDGNMLSYYITDENDNKLFAGKAYRRPDEDRIKVKINSICRNYLSNDLRPLLDSYYGGTTSDAESPTGIRVFKLYDSNDIMLESYELLYDWSYEVHWNGNDMTLSRPINGRATSMMFRPMTTIEGHSVFNSLWAGGGTLYKIIDGGCNAEYAIYYLNSYGGWDAFLFEGKAVKKDTITQFTTDRSFNNQTVDYEAYRYVSEINTSYTLSTGWLNDEQAANFAKNLVGSNHVYLQNLKTGDFFSAIITDSSVTYQTMKNNGGKMAIYQLNVKESQNKLRQ